MIKDKLDYEIFNKHNWIYTKKLNCIISPDIDGILCGMLMSHYFDWIIVGFYDGKQLLIHDSCNNINECVFLDMEIYRKDIRSIGQHMLLYNKNNIPSNWNNFNCTINPNVLRNYDALKNFPQKYPFGTIHLLMSILFTLHQCEISIQQEAIPIFLYVDGTFKNLLNYPENCIEWLEFMYAKDEKHPLSKLLNVFAVQRLSNIMHNLENIFRQFESIGNGKKGGDKIKMSNYNPITRKFENHEQIILLLKFVSELTKWEFNENKWRLHEMKFYTFEKRIKEKLNNSTYQQIMNVHPLSFAITATKRIEYTISNIL